jgi:uncharacterized protein YjiS (DUF1127 family)
MFVTLILSKVRAWLLYRETVSELERLTDRDLLDVGIGRRRIKEIARQATLSRVPTTA